VPLYTYECPQGHQWDEVRSADEDSQVSEAPCQTCLEAVDDGPIPIPAGVIRQGRKVVSQVSVKLSGKGWTPKFYTNRKGK
jgi:predicted nucleic acid-binding Zn ribbon protein